MSIGSKYFRSASDEADYEAECLHHNGSMSMVGFNRSGADQIQHHIQCAIWRLDNLRIEYNQDDLRAAYWGNDGANARRLALTIDRLVSNNLLSQKNFNALMKGDADRLNEIVDSLSNPKLNLVQELFDNVIDRANANSALSLKCPPEEE